MISMPHTGRRQAGFTLIELMVALALSLVLAVALLVMQVNLGKNTMRNSDVGVRDVQARAAMDLITQDVSSAGFMLGGTSVPCNTLMTYNGTGYYFHHAVDGLAGATGTALNFGLTAGGVVQSLDYPPAGMPSDVLVATLTSNGASFAAGLRRLGVDPLNSPTGAGKLPLANVKSGLLPTAGMALNDVGLAQVQMGSRWACMRAKVTGVTANVVQSSATTYANYAGQMAAAGYAGALTDAEFYNASYFADLGQVPAAAPVAPAMPPYATVAYYVSNNAGSYPVLMRSVYNLLDDSLTYSQPVAAGVVSLQVLYGVDTTNSGVVTPPYLTALQVTTAKQWDQVQSVRLAMVMRSLVDDPDPLYYWTPTAGTPGTAATATGAGTISFSTVEAPWATVPVPMGSKRRYLLQQTEIAARNLLW